MKRKPVSKQSKQWASSGFVPKPSPDQFRPVDTKQAAATDLNWLSSASLLILLSGLIRVQQGKKTSTSQSVDKPTSRQVQPSGVQLLPDSYSQEAGWRPGKWPGRL